MKQQDAGEVYRSIIESLVFGEASMLVAEQENQKEKNSNFLDEIDEEKKSPQFIMQETFTQKNMQFYLATNVRCLHSDYDSWNFTLSSDLILDILLNYSQTNMNIKMGYGLETRVVGSKIDSRNAMDEMNWTKAPSTKQAKKKPKSKPIIEVNKKNILGGEGGLLEDEFDQQKWQKEKIQAQTLLDDRMNEDKFMMENNHFDTLIDAVKDKVPDFDQDNDTLYCPDHVVQIPSGDKALRIEDLLDNYFMTRMLNNQDHNYMSPALRGTYDEENDIRFVTKMFRLYSAPKHFAISLKRFKQIPGGLIASFQKDETQVNYDLTLDFTKYFLSKIF